jgi:predicted transcriptional regulator
MIVHLTPEQETRLAELAARDGRSAEQLVQDALDQFFEADADFIEAVLKGMASLDHGQYVSHEEVGKRIDRLLQS